MWAHLCDDLRRLLYKYTPCRVAISRRHVLDVLKYILEQPQWSWSDFMFVWSCRYMHRFDHALVNRVVHMLRIRRRKRKRNGQLSWRRAITEHMRRRCKGCGRTTTQDVFGVMLCGHCTNNYRLKHTYMINKQRASILVPRAYLLRHGRFKTRAMGGHLICYEDVVQMSQHNTQRNHEHSLHCCCRICLSGSLQERRRVRLVDSRLDLL